MGLRPTAPSTLNRLNLHGPLLPCMFFIVVYALSHGIGISSFDTITRCRVFGLFGIKPRASKGNLVLRGAFAAIRASVDP